MTEWRDIKTDPPPTLTERLRNRPRPTREQFEDAGAPHLDERLPPPGAIEMTYGKGWHYYPASHYSVPAERICWHRDTSPNADYFCTREKGHKGKHIFEWSPTVRRHSHREAPEQSK